VQSGAEWSSSSDCPAYVRVVEPAPYKAPPIDPLDTMMAWLSSVGREQIERVTRSSRQICLSDAMLQRKVWDKVEIEEWIERNCVRDVVAQRMTDGWTLTFVESSDHDAFFRWWSDKSADAPVEIRLSYKGHEAEMREWLMANVRASNFRAYSCWLGDPIFFVRFRDDTDRTHFIMRWAGQTEKNGEEAA